MRLAIRDDSVILSFRDSRDLLIRQRAIRKYARASICSNKCHAGQVLLGRRPTVGLPDRIGPKLTLYDTIDRETQALLRLLGRTPKKEAGAIRLAVCRGIILIPAENTLSSQLDHDGLGVSESRSTDSDPGEGG